MSPQLDNGATANNLFDFITCPDHHRCYHGSLCIEDTANEEGTYFCDCTATLAGSIYAGVACEHQATSYCNDDNEISSVSFCTNNGVCKDKTTWKGPHMGCTCVDGYKGDFCEFVDTQSIPDNYAALAAMVPSTAAATASSPSGKSVHPVAIVAILLVTAAVMSVFAFIIYRQRQLASTHMIDRSKGDVSDMHNTENEVDKPSSNGDRIMSPTQTMATEVDDAAANEASSAGNEKTTSNSNNDSNSADTNVIV